MKYINSSNDVLHGHHTYDILKRIIYMELRNSNRIIWGKKTPVFFLVGYLKKVSGAFKAYEHSLNCIIWSAILFRVEFRVDNLSAEVLEIFMQGKLRVFRISLCSCSSQSF